VTKSLFKMKILEDRKANHMLSKLTNLSQ